MAFKMGDGVYHKSNLDMAMTIHGFMPNRGDNFAIADTEPTDWVVCKYIKPDGTAVLELFYDLELTAEDDV
jgi:hypothetical protein